MKLNTRIVLASLLGALLFLLFGPSPSSLGNKIILIYPGIIGAVFGSLFAGRETVPGSLRTGMALMLSKLCASIVSSDRPLIVGCVCALSVSSVRNPFDFASAFIALGVVGNIYIFSKIALKFLPDPNTKVQLVSSYE